MKLKIGSQPLIPAPQYKTTQTLAYKKDVQGLVSSTFFFFFGTSSIFLLIYTQCLLFIYLRLLCISRILTCTRYSSSDMKYSSKSWCTEKLVEKRRQFVQPTVRQWVSSISSSIYIFFQSKLFFQHPSPIYLNDVDFLLFFFPPTSLRSSDLKHIYSYILIYGSQFWEGFYQREPALDVGAG